VANLKTKGSFSKLYTWLPIILLFVLLIAMLFTACYGWTVEKLAYKVF